MIETVLACLTGFVCGFASVTSNFYGYYTTPGELDLKWLPKDKEVYGGLMTCGITAKTIMLGVLVCYTHVFGLAVASGVTLAVIIWIFLPDLVIMCMDKVKEQIRKEIKDEKRSSDCYAGCCTPTPTDGPDNLL